MKIIQHRAFRKDLKRMARQGKDLAKLKKIIDLLLEEKPLPKRCSDHALTGNWKGWRDCHIELDWLLIYKPTKNELILARCGSHSDLF